MDDKPSGPALPPQKAAPDAPVAEPPVTATRAPDATELRLAEDEIIVVPVRNMVLFPASCCL